MVFARRHRLALELGLLALVAWLAALGVSETLRLAAVDLPPAPAEAPARGSPAPAPLADYAVIAARDIFNPPRGERPERTTDLRLWGVALEGREARAVIGDTATGRQDLYRVGEEVGGARIAAIDWDRVTLARGDGEEVLELSAPESPSAREPPVEPVREAVEDRIRRTGEDAFVVDRRALAGSIDNPSGLMTELRAVAEVQDGRPAGFRLFRIRDDSLFARLGLRDGDVVQRVNGAEVANPSALLGFLERLRSEPRVALDIVRGDAPRTLVYDLR